MCKILYITDSSFLSIILHTYINININKKYAIIKVNKIYLSMNIYYESLYN